MESVKFSGARRTKLPLLQDEKACQDLMVHRDRMCAHQGWQWWEQTDADGVEMSLPAPEQLACPPAQRGSYCQRGARAAAVGETAHAAVGWAYARYPQQYPKSTCATVPLTMPVPPYSDPSMTMSSRAGLPEATARSTADLMACGSTMRSPCTPILLAIAATSKGRGNAE
jgi:hypothetical protein